MALIAALTLASCTKPGPENGGKASNTMSLVDAGGHIIKNVKMTAAVGFVSEAGMYSMYAADVPALTKEMLLGEYEFPEDCNIAAVSTIFSLVGQKVDITKESMHFLMSLKFTDVCDYDLMEGSLDEEIIGGYFKFDVDTEKLTARLELKIDLNDGNSILCDVAGVYTPGGENETLFVWNDMSRPVRAAFYDDSETGSGAGAGVGSNPPIMYFASGQIDYGAELSKTTYARIRPAASICDGKSHDIAQALKDGTLEFMVRDFDSEWDVIGGTISIKHIDGYEYIVVVENAEAEDRGHALADASFRMFFQGELKDIHIERQIVNAFEIGGKSYAVKSCVVDLSSDVAAIYMVQTEGVTTVEAATAANPLVINFSTAKFGKSIGLSTDKANFAVSYGGERWDKSNLDTGSFICHEYNPETGLLHCQLANICLQVTYKTVVKMEYKGTPVYVR